MDTIEQPAPETPPIFIISGGAGALGKHVARIALSQFAGLNPQIVVIPQICSYDQLAEAIAQVAERRGIIIYTMVDPKIRQALAELAQNYQITAIDTIGDPLAALARDRPNNRCRGVDAASPLASGSLRLERRPRLLGHRGTLCRGGFWQAHLSQRRVFGDQRHQQADRGNRRPGDRHDQPLLRAYGRALTWVLGIRY